MQKNSIIAATVILFVVVVGMFTFAFIENKKTGDTTLAVPTVMVPEKEPYENIKSIDAKHFFTNGTHTIVGNIPLPTQCELLDWNVFIAESFPEQVRIDFGVINNSDGCAKVVTEQRFSVSFEANKQATVTARLEGRDVILNLIPATEGESADDFELFIKG